VFWVANDDSNARRSLEFVNVVNLLKKRMSNNMNECEWTICKCEGLQDGQTSMLKVRKVTAACCLVYLRVFASITGGVMSRNENLPSQIDGDGDNKSNVI